MKENFLVDLLHPPFLSQKYTFWSLDPRGDVGLPCAQDRLKTNVRGRALARATEGVRFQGRRKRT